MLNAGTLLKVIWSVIYAGETGWASLLPSIVTLAICDSIILLSARWLSRRRIHLHHA